MLTKPLKMFRIVDLQAETAARSVKIVLPGSAAGSRSADGVSLVPGLPDGLFPRTDRNCSN
jgi:hypothetical protein